MRGSLIVLVVLGGVAWADLPAPVVVKSVTTTSGDNAEIWKLPTTGNGNWCQAKLSHDEALTITLAAPAAIASVAIRAESSVTGAEIVADGKSFTGEVVVQKGALPTSSLVVRLGGGPVTTLVVKLVGSGHACVSGIDLGVRVVYSADASTLWSDLRAAKAALSSCKTKELAGAFAFPVTAFTYTEDQDGMKEKTRKWTTAAKLSTGCKDKLLRSWNDSLKLEDPTLESTSATTLDVHEDRTWSLEYASGHWKVRSFNIQ